MPAPRVLAVHSWKPCVPLRPFLDGFNYRHIDFTGAPMYHPLPARNDSFLEFYFEDSFQVFDVASATVRLAPRVVIVGPQATRREDILHPGRLRVFHISFSPIGLRAIFGIPPRTLANRAEPAETVLGRGVLALAERLEASPVAHWPTLTEHFLLASLAVSRPLADDLAAARLTRSLGHPDGALRLSSIANQHGCSVRKLERLFEEYVGLPPKLYSRIVRLHTALRLSSSPVAPDWATVAAAAGYFDQSHMVRDFRSLTGETPTRFRALQSNGHPPF